MESFKKLVKRVQYAKQEKKGQNKTRVGDFWYCTAWSCTSIHSGHIHIRIFSLRIPKHRSQNIALFNLERRQNAYTNTHIHRKKPSVQSVGRQFHMRTKRAMCKMHFSADSTSYEWTTQKTTDVQLLLGLLFFFEWIKDKRKNKMNRIAAEWRMNWNQIKFSWPTLLRCCTSGKKWLNASVQKKFSYCFGSKIATPLHQTNKTCFVCVLFSFNLEPLEQQ